MAGVNQAHCVIYDVRNEDRCIEAALWKAAMLSVGSYLTSLRASVAYSTVQMKFSAPVTLRQAAASIFIALCAFSAFTTASPLQSSPHASLEPRATVS